MGETWALAEAVPGELLELPDVDPPDRKIFGLTEAPNSSRSKLARMVSREGLTR